MAVYTVFVGLVLYKFRENYLGGGTGALMKAFVADGIVFFLGFVGEYRVP